MADLATKENVEKPLIELVPPEAIVGIAKVLTFGAKKYAPNNWRKGLPYSRTYGSVQRHLLAWYQGEEIDADSGLPHLFHAMADIMFLENWNRMHPELDDRITETKQLQLL